MNKPSKTARNATLKIGIVFDDSLDSDDGVAQYVKRLGKWLSSEGHEVRYLVGQTKMKNWEKGRVYSLSRNIPVFFNGNRLSMPLPARQSRINEILQYENFDVIHVQMPFSPFMAKKVIDQAHKNSAILGTFHILPMSKTSFLGTKLLKLAYGSSLKKFNKFFSVSSSAAGFAKATLGIESTVMPNVVDVESFMVHNPKRSHDKKIVFLGRLVKRKGIFHLVKAFSKTLNAMPEVKLIIAGDGPQRQKLEKLIRKLQIEKNVNMLGYIKEEEKPRLLASADIACFPAVGGESFGIVLIEAMAAGSRTVIGGDNPGYRTVLRPPALFNPKDIHQFSRLLKQLLEDDRLAASLHNFQQESIKQYDVNVVGEKLLREYSIAVDKKTKKRHT